MDRLFRRYLIVLTPAVVAGILIPPAAAEPPPSAVWKPIARIDHRVLQEPSGLVASQRHPGVLWSHGDSGREPKLVALDTNGTVLAEVWVDDAPNIDWEDIASDPEGHLYIADTGNNVGFLPARYIYKLSEPDPRSPPQEPVKPLERRRYVLPRQDRFDAEALFWHNDTLFVHSRARKTPARLYRLVPVGSDAYRLESLAPLNLPIVTAADTSPDDRQLLLVGPRAAAMFRFTETGDAIVDPASRQVVFYPREGGDIEGGCFAAGAIFLIAENRNLFRVSFEDFAAGRRFTVP